MNAVPSASRRDAMLRIAMVSPYSLTIPGGVQHQVLGLARELRRMGHEVRVLGPCDGPPPEPFVTPLGNSLPTMANGSTVPLAPDPSAALRTLRALNDEAFDILHLHEPMAPGPTVTALMLRLAPMVGTFHASGEIAWYRRVRKGLEWLGTHLDHRVAVSAAARDMAARHVGGSFEVLYNGIDIDTYRRPHLRRERHPTILFCGRHEPRKGLETLLDAFLLLPDDFRLWVCSDGPNIADVRKRYTRDPHVAERIEWLGQVSETEKIERLARCTVFCAPSLHGESFGLVLLEAMAAQTPVVASDIDGYNIVVTHDRNGVLVTAGDAAALAQALRHVGTDDTLRARLVAAGNERAEELSMRTLAERYVEIYREVLTAEAEARIVVQPSAAVRYFEDRLLRRPRIAKLSQVVRDSVTETVADTMASLRDRTAQLRERVAGERTAHDEGDVDLSEPDEPSRER
ncbi:MAG: glycosyltransferase family 4 protein [Ilumatobacteraceae bacterium]